MHQHSGVPSQRKAVVPSKQDKKKTYFVGTHWLPDHVWIPRRPMSQKKRRALARSVHR